MEIVRLKAEDYDEWLSVLKTVFSARDKKDVDFEKELPKMCVKDDYHMGMHLAVRENGKICALLGIYPLKTHIGNKEVMFSTVGNVATLPECEGRGYMKALMGEAMRELERIGADASRLCGVRQRYNRYGYEACGTEYNFSIDDYTVKYCFAGGEEVTFKEISLEDKAELSFINKIRESELIKVIRSENDAYFGEYTSLCAWYNKPFIALDKNGEFIGYVSSSADKSVLAEAMGKDFEALKKIIYNWQKYAGCQISFNIPCYNREAIKYFSSVAEETAVKSPCHFKIINFDTVADALIKIKALYADLPAGKRVIEIEDWGRLLLCTENGEPFCEKTDMEPDIRLDKLSAARLLFGPFEADTVIENDAFLSALLPLPLSWSTLDRV